MSNKRYFPHKWELIKSCPAVAFPSIEFDHFMEWKVGGWELPDEISCMIRTDDVKTGKVKEFTYKSTRTAQPQVDELFSIGGHDITIRTHHTGLFIPLFFADDDDN